MIRTHFLAANAVRISHASADGRFEPDRPWVPFALPGLRGKGAGEGETDKPLVEVTDEAGFVVMRAHGAEFFREVRTPETRPARTRWRVMFDIPRWEFGLRREQTEGGVELEVALTPGEGLYGWGEWFNAFRRERGTVRLEARDAIALVQSRATYSALPFFLSTRGYGFLLLNSHASRWRLEPEQGRVAITADGPGSDYVVIYGPQFRDILATLTDLTGRPPLIPRWAFGLCVTQYPQESQDAVVRLAQMHRAHRIPLDGIILDYHWEEAFHNFRWRKSLFPNPAGLVRDLTALGVRLGLIVTPFLNNRSRPIQKRALNRMAHNIPPGLEDDDERVPAEFEEARSKGLLAHPATKWWFGAGGMMDFTNPAASACWNARLAGLYDQGVSFFKNDDGEYLPPEGRSVLGMDGREYHNLYGLFYGRALYEGMAARNDKRPFLMARSVWIGSQRFPGMFLGDQHPTFEHMQSTMSAGLNLSLLGFSYWLADVFGLDGKTTPETHMRYAQWALLNPLARYFVRPPQIDDTRAPWSHGATAEDNFRTYAALRYRLLPYSYALAWAAYRTGMPIVRPMLLEFPEDLRFANVTDQYMLGPALLVAPVVHAGETRRRIRLPAGAWYDYWSGSRYAGGGEIDYDAPWDRLPILARGGHILALGPALEHIPDDHSFNEITLKAYPPYPAECVIYDDDGITRAYERGEAEQLPVRIEPEGEGLRVQVGPVEGSYPGQPETRQLGFVLHDASAPRCVIQQQTPVAWTYDPGARAVSFSLQLRAEETLRLRVE